MTSIVLIAFGGSTSTSAQQPAPTATLPPSITATPTITTDLENKLYKLEIAQEESIRVLELANQNNRGLSLFMGFIISFIVGVQTIVTFTQLNREKERNKLQAERETTQDLDERAGVKQISGIMTVLQQTLESRLLTETETRSQLAEVKSKFEGLDNFYQRFQSNVKKIRNEIETDAFQLATTVARHGFKGIPEKLNAFADQFDRFELDYEPIETIESTFSARVPYIRGIVAHFANRPDMAEEFLKQVISSLQPESNEDILSFQRRVANAYYYLGLIEFNFGRFSNALEYFENSNKLDLRGRDFLTKVVIAEAYVLAGELDKANAALDEIDVKFTEILSRGDALPKFEMRLRSRTALIRSNILILTHQTGWENKVEQHLQPIVDDDPLYYYATATVAQAYHSQENYQVAKQLFQSVYEIIVSVADIHTIKEVRSKILLLMLAGMASKYLGDKEERSKEFLDQAKDLLPELPSIRSQVCTVFSVLSKRNENSDTIKQHIELIRNGLVLLDLNKKQS